MPHSSDSTPDVEYKIIHDTVHGTIKLIQPFLRLLETPELQRLNSIHQLGLAYLVFPGANHTRLEHSLGTYHVAARMANALNLDEDERSLVAAAALLHDIGHGPYSHTLEYLFSTRLGLTHTDLTRMIILGEEEILDDDHKQVLNHIPRKSISDILENHNIDPAKVIDLICTESREFDGMIKLTEDLPIHDNQQFFNTKKYLYQIIHSTIDADQIDYLLRDSHYTGVAYGVLDIDRLIQTIEVFNNDLVINKHGLSAVEGMLVARTLMYSSVYFHKTVRIAELMLSRALERLGAEQLREFLVCSEAELVHKFIKLGGLQGELITFLLYRHLFKRAFHLKHTDLDDATREALLRLETPDKRLALEDAIAARAGVPKGHVIIDIPLKELKVSEPRIHQTDINILDKTVKPLSKYTPLAKALQQRNIPDWAVMVATDKKYIEPVAKVAEKLLFD